MKTNTFMRTLFQIAFLLLINSNLMAQTDSITVRVKGMRCEECAHKVKNVVKNTSDIIHAVIDIVLCVRTMLEKNGYEKNLVIY